MKFLTETIRESYDTTIEIFKILIPVIVIVKILAELGIVEWLSRLLTPVMGLVGLPGETAIVWAAAISTNIYGGIATLLAVMPDGGGLSVAQMSVLMGMVLVCHSLPVELSLTQKVGGSFKILGPLRFLGALVYGAIVNGIYQGGGWLQEPAVIHWVEQRKEETLADWAVNQGWNLVNVAVVLFCLLLMMRILKALRITDLLAKLLKPFLLLMGISDRAATIAVIGLLAGITFGSGLLIAEAKKHKIPDRELLLVLAFLSLCHGVIEDSALALLLGGHHSGIVWLRVVFALSVVGIMARLPFVRRWHPEESGVS